MNKKALEKMIVLCWVLLAICFVIKIFGGNFFEYVGKSEVAEYIETNFILLTLVQFVFYLIQSYLYYLVIFKNKHKLIILLFTAIMFAVKVLSFLFEEITIFATITEFIFLIVVPIFYNKKQWYMPILLNILIIIYQMISLFIKNINIVSFPDTNIVGYVYMIDYYIMLVLTYLYFTKGDFNMGRLGFWFLSKEEQQLKDYKKLVVDKHNKKIDKLNKKHTEKIEKIDDKIAKC